MLMLKTGRVRCDSYIYQHFVFSERRLSVINSIMSPTQAINVHRIDSSFLQSTTCFYYSAPVIHLICAKIKSRKNKVWEKVAIVWIRKMSSSIRWQRDRCGFCSPLICIELDGFVIIKPFQRTPVVLTSIVTERGANKFMYVCVSHAVESARGP